MRHLSHAKLLLVAAISLSVISANAQQLQDLIDEGCADARIENFCNVVFGEAFCIWIPSPNGTGSCTAPSLSSDYCVSRCGDIAVTVFDNFPTCSCAVECEATRTCCPGYTEACGSTAAPSTAPTAVPSTPSPTTSAPVSASPTKSPTEAFRPNVDSCICFPEEPGCVPDDRVGNWTGCASTAARLRSNGRRCYCDSACHLTVPGCCPDYESVCVTSSPTSTPSKLPTESPTAPPTFGPTAIPTSVPSNEPSEAPTPVPTAVPSAQPSISPTTRNPTIAPSPRYGTCACTDDSDDCISRDHNGATYCGTPISRLTEQATHCFCDEACALIGNCCPDYEELCLTGAPTIPPTSSVPSLAPSPAPTPLFGTCRCTGPEYDPSCNNNLHPELNNYTLCGTRVAVFNTDFTHCFCTDACVDVGNCCDDYYELCVITTTSTVTTVTSTTTTVDKYYVPIQFEPSLPPFLNETRLASAVGAIETMLTIFGSPSTIRSVDFQDGVRRQVSGPSMALISFWSLEVAEILHNAACTCTTHTVFTFEGEPYYVSLQSNHGQYLPQTPEIACATSCAPTTTDTTLTSSTSVTSTSTTLTTSTFTSTTTDTSVTSSTMTSRTETSSTTTESSTTVSTTSTRTFTTSTLTVTTRTSSTISTTTVDPCISILCAINCNGSCGWHVIIGHPNEGLCETGYVTTDATRTLGCNIASPPTVPVTITLENDAEASTEPWIYLVVVFLLIAVAAAFIVWHGRNQRKKSAYDMSQSQLPYQTDTSTVQPSVLNPIPEYIHQGEPEPAAMSEQSILAEQERIREESRRARQEFEELTNRAKQEEARARDMMSSQNSTYLHDVSTKAQTTRTRAPVPDSELPIWYHGELDAESARAKIERTGIRNGRFLIRKDQEGNYIVAVAHRGVVKTYYAMPRDDDFVELYDETGERIEPMFQDLVDLVSALSSDYLPTGWRVRFKEAVHRDTGEFIPIDSGVLSSMYEATDITVETPAPDNSYDRGDGGHYISVAPPEAQSTNQKEFDPFDSSNWLHGITKGKDAAFSKMGTLEDGVFMVERHSNEGWYIINVNYNGRGTRHLVTPNDEGILMITKRRYGDSTTIESLINALSEDVRPGKWPVKLVRPILVEQSEPDPGPERHPEPEPEPPAVLPREPEVTPAVAPHLRTESDATDLTSEATYLHGTSISKEKSFAVIKDFDPSYSSGVFMVEHEKTPGRFVLNVCYKGKPTRHLVAQNANGVYLINNKDYGGFTSIKELIMTLSSPSLPAGWPVRLTRAVPPSMTSTVAAAAAPDAVQSIAESAPSSESSSKWIHSEVFDKVAGKEWSTGLAGTDTNGRFIIRTKEPGIKYVLSVVFKNRMTEHMIILDPEGMTSINGKQYGNGDMYNIDDLVRILSTSPMPKEVNSGKPWPAPLIEGRNALTQSWEAVGSTASASVSASSGPSTGSSNSWYHAIKNGQELTREEAVQIIKPSELPQGSFVVREHIPSSPGAEEYVLSVSYKGRGTHHLIKREDGILKVNNKDFGRQWSSIDQLINDLAQDDGVRPASWPVQLRI